MTASKHSSRLLQSSFKHDERQHPLVELVEPLGHVDGIGDKTLDLRNASGMYGLGLIEVVPDDAIIANAMMNLDADFGIRGIARSSNIEGEDGRVGRFGWKASFATLDAQVRNAITHELGLGNSSMDDPAVEYDREVERLGAF